MSSKKIEFLKDRLSEEQKSANPRGALKHLDAARARLEELQVWRRQMKIDFSRCEEERDNALQSVAELEALTNEQEEEIEDLQQFISEQKKLINRLRADHDALKERTRLTRKRRVSDEEEGPALTVLAMEKVTPAKAQHADDNPTNVDDSADTLLKKLYGRFNQITGHDQSS
ncbi:MAG: hypothetical protein OEU86_03250 [Gammaproteobacteria bacterium]|nr:hypothetical protein [Gammaproteobacteria bacterium]